jgi:hypothetical protein
MPDRLRWPSKEEIRQLQEVENLAAEEAGDDPDPICECGEPGYGCRCLEMSERMGAWHDGTEYKKKPVS